MAKVMISMPDDLLSAVDAEARRRSTTRSGVLRAFAGEALRRRGADRAARIAQLEVAPHGGRGLEELKRRRP